MSLWPQLANLAPREVTVAEPSTVTPTGALVYGDWRALSSGDLWVQVGTSSDATLYFAATTASTDRVEMSTSTGGYRGVLVGVGRIVHQPDMLLHLGRQ